MAVKEFLLGSDPEKANHGAYELDFELGFWARNCAVVDCRFVVHDVHKNINCGWR